MYSVLFCDIRHPDPAKYVETVLTRWSAALGGDDGPARASRIRAEAEKVAEFGAVAPVTAEAADLPEFDADTASAMRDMEACVLRELRSQMLGHPDERFEEDSFTYLLEPYEGLAANAVVLRRVTDLATLYVFPSGWSLRGRQLVFRAEPEPAPLRQPDLPDEEEPSPARKIAEGLANALLDGVLGEFAGMIIAGIFPDSLPSYFAEVYRELEKMFKRVLIKLEIDKINGKINGLKTWVKIDYRNAKKSGASKEKLTELLRPKVDDLTINVLGVLQTDPFREPGLPTFLITAGMHLALLQELALVDPASSDPPRSPHYQSIRDYAQQYAGYTEGMTRTIVDRRKSYCWLKYDAEVVCGVRCVSTPAWVWGDSLTGYISDHYTDVYRDKKVVETGRERAERDMIRHRGRVVAQVLQKMNRPDEIAKKWRRLIDQPIPPKALRKG